MNILLSWIGSTDKRSAATNDHDKPGPVLQALAEITFDHIVLLATDDDAETRHFLAWANEHTGRTLNFRHIKLGSPNDHQEVYAAARAAVREALDQYPEANLTFHTSPGTPAMAFAWLLLAPSHRACLIESSRDYGVKKIHLPFEIYASFLPDRELAHLARGDAPAHAAFKDILHESTNMRTLIKRAQHVAKRDVSVLIEGESGTGKELFARAIHDASLRSKKKFIPINCGAIPSELIESQLFGHEKGSFTGAVQASSGLFREANGGTIFLDEIGELPLLMQVKLLRVLQEKEVLPIGAATPASIDVRVIAAGNKDLLKEVRSGTFRSDLFYRLAVAVLRLPPLRERREDIGIILDGALAEANKELGIQEHSELKKFSDAARKVFLEHPWPGNVRELKNTVIRAALWSQEEIIDELTAQQVLLTGPDKTGSILDLPIGNEFSLDALLSNVESHYLERALHEAHGNKTRAANLLGLASYQTFSNRWGKHFPDGIHKN